MQKEEFVYSTSDVKDGRRHHKKTWTMFQPWFENKELLNILQWNMKLKIVRAGEDHPMVCEPEQGCVSNASLVARTWKSDAGVGWVLGSSRISSVIPGGNSGSFKWLVQKPLPTLSTLISEYHRTLTGQQLRKVPNSNGEFSSSYRECTYSIARGRNRRSSSVLPSWVLPSGFPKCLNTLPNVGALSTSDCICH